MRDQDPLGAAPTTSWDDADGLGATEGVEGGVEVGLGTTDARADGATATLAAGDPAWGAELQPMSTRTLAAPMNRRARVRLVSGRRMSGRFQSVLDASDRRA